MLGANIRSITVLLLILVTSLPATAQSSLTIADYLDPNYQNTDLLYNREYATVKGSPYLFEDWAKGSVKVSSGAVLDNLNLKFDLYSNNLILKTSDGDEMMIAKAAIDEFSLNDRQLGSIREFKLVNIGLEWNFFEILHRDKIYVYKHTELSITAKANNAGGYAADTESYQKFTRKNSYFLGTNGTDLQRVKLNKSSITTTLNNHIKELNKYIKSEKLKLSQEAHVIKLIKYYESL